MRHLDLFSGIGGFALAARWCGWRTVGFCEVDEWCQRVLAKNFPGVPIHDDIQTLTGATVEAWGGADVLTGGFPCQPYSVAGKRRGAEDDRALWPEMRRVIAEVRPRWVLGENVTGIIRLELDAVLSDLEALGYTCWPLVIPAVGTDAPHRRDRVWIVAHADSEGESTLSVDGDTRCGELGQAPLAHAESSARRRIASREAGQSALSGEAVAHAGIERCAHPDQEVQAGRDEPEHGGEHAAHADRAGREEQRRTQPARAQHPSPQCGCRWTPEPPVGRVAHGLPHRVDRLRGLGNAIVPQVAYQIMRRMS